VNAHHQEVADVYVEDGIIVAVKPDLKVFNISSLSFFFLICTVAKALLEVGLISIFLTQKQVNKNWKKNPIFFNCLQVLDFVLFCFFFVD